MERYDLKYLICMLNHIILFAQIVKGPRGDPGPEGPPVSF